MTVSKICCVISIDETDNIKKVLILLTFSVIFNNNNYDLQNHHYHMLQQSPFSYCRFRFAYFKNMFLKTQF